MTYLLRTAIPARITGLVLVLAAVAVVSGACSGGSTKLDAALIGAPALGSTQTGNGASDSAGQLPALPALPRPSQIDRSASLMETGLVVRGASFRDDLTHQSVSVDGEACRFDPAFLSVDDPKYSQVALAIYSFDVSSVSDVELELLDFELDGLQDLVIGTARVYAGVPAVSLDRWEWTELEKKPSPIEMSAFSWGMSNSGSLRQRAPNGVLNVCVVVFGDTALSVSRVAWVSPPSATGPLMQELFRKAHYDLKKNEKARLASISVDCDDSDRVHVSYFDDSNSQLYYLQVDGRNVRDMALDCDAPVGSSSSVCVTPQGGLLAAYSDDSLHQGVYRWMAPESMSSLVWSPRSNFDDGDDGSGKLTAVGAQCRCVFEADGSASVFYLDTDSHQVKRASFQLGSLAVEDFVSPPGEFASCPAPVSYSDGSCVAYLSRSPGSSVVRLMLATRDAVGAWSSSVLADDVHLPDSLDLDDDCDGFCDASMVPGTDEVVVAYSSPNGFSVVHFDLSSSSVRLRESPTRASSGGAFVSCAAMADGSVRVCHYDTASRTIYIEIGGVEGEAFVSLPAVQYGEDTDEDCDGLDFWLDPDSDDDGFHQAVLVTLSSSVTPLGQSKKEFKGHVTLLK